MSNDQSSTNVSGQLQEHIHLFHQCRLTLLGAAENIVRHVQVTGPIISCMIVNAGQISTTYTHTAADQKCQIMHARAERQRDECTSETRARKKNLLFCHNSVKVFSKSHACLCGIRTKHVAVRQFVNRDFKISMLIALSGKKYEKQ